MSRELQLHAGWAKDGGEEIQFGDADVFLELNNTDGDLGFHSSIDGDAWKYLWIEDPRDRKILYIRTAGKLRRHGLTQLDFESAEPSFDDLNPRIFFRRFPEGEYEIEGRTVDGQDSGRDLFGYRVVLPGFAESIAMVFAHNECPSINWYCALRQWMKWPRQSRPVSDYRFRPFFIVFFRSIKNRSKIPIRMLDGWKIDGMWDL